MRISQDHLDEIVAHALEERPNECCGIVSGSGGVAAKVFRAGNELASPYSYRLDSQDQLRIYNEIDERGEEILAIYHSHVKSPAEPSESDRNHARTWPEPVWLICSLQNPEAPRVRGWSMRDGSVNEVELETGA